MLKVIICLILAILLTIWLADKPDKNKESLKSTNKSSLIIITIIIAGILLLDLILRH